MSNGFPIVRLGEVLTPVERPEQPVPGKAYRQVGVKLWGQGAYERNPIDGAQTRYQALWRVETGDIILNKIWARNGSVAVVPESLAGRYVSNEFPTFSAVREKLEPRWFHWLTKTPMFWEQCDKKSRGTSGKNRIRPERFLEIEIPRPPLAEQRRIVARIEELAAKIEEGFSLRRPAETQASAIIAAERNAIVARYPKLVFETLIDNTLLGLVRSSAEQDPSKPVPYLKMNNITRDGRINLAEVARVDASPRELATYKIQRGDFLFNTRNSFDLVGKTAVWDRDNRDFVFNNNIMRIRFREGVSAEFMNQAFLSSVVQTQLRASKKQTTNVCALYWKNLRGIEVPVPKLEEQRRIVAHLGDLQSKVDELGALQTKTAAELDALLPSILDKAFKGEL